MAFLVADNTDFFSVPPAGVSNELITAVEVQKIEEKSLDALVVLVLFQQTADIVQIVFVDDFIRLNVKSPISGDGVKSDIALLGKDFSTCAQVFVPDGIDYLYFGGSDGQNGFARAVGGIADGNDEFVADGQNGLDGLEKGVTIGKSISDV